MNGNTLKWAFSVIVWTMCGVLIAATIMCLFGKLTFSLWAEVIKELGVPAFFTMVTQSYLHSDRNRDGIPDHQQTVEIKGGKDEKSIIVSSNTAGIDTSIKSSPGDNPADKPDNK